MGHNDGFAQFSFGLLPLVINNKKAWPYSFILGADDPEMTEIEKILTAHGERFQYATHDGNRVHPGNAYKADPVLVEIKSIAVLIECEPLDFFGSNAVVRVIDHHRLGDPGFNLSSKLYWEASSLGQLYKLLNLGTPTAEHLTLAALDHCMVQARRGKCPGVDPEILKSFSRQHIATRKGIDVSIVEAYVSEMCRKVEDSPVIIMGTQEVVDLTRIRMGVGYSLEYLCAQEALADLHKVALIRTKNRAGHPDKVIICGAATSDTIQFFIDTWAPANDLTKVYGVPLRGYAGGYLE